MLSNQVQLGQHVFFYLLFAFINPFCKVISLFLFADNLCVTLPFQAFMWFFTCWSYLIDIGLLDRILAEFMVFDLMVLGNRIFLC